MLLKHIFILVTFWLLAITGKPWALDLTTTAGIDVWNTADTAVRYLPNYRLPTGYVFQEASSWVDVKSSHTVKTNSGDFVFSGAAMYHQLTGGRIDRFSVDWKNSSPVGIHVGILPYRVSWCRSPGESTWIIEPDAYCRYHGLREVAQGSFGTQAYTSKYYGGWLLDGMISAYYPKILSQDAKLGPYVSVGPDANHNKYGISLNTMHLNSGTQFRIGWLHTKQDQDSYSGSYQRRMRYNMTYVAAELPTTSNTSVRISANTNIGSQVNTIEPYAWQGRSITIEYSVLLNNNTISLGLSEYRNRTTYTTGPNNQIVTVPSASIAWQHQLTKDTRVISQITHSIDESVTRKDISTNRKGTALGLRLMHVF